ncbi:hypothetical protein QFC22_004695 [Naganishia vaughanmartiniae]|uniref:Uncharacterized protein n=1 Tax=Naganishia vaughanmartiniae TaxID=1424756 RepID=A0ACC2X065_9TREE|nr:hypothetical protein QFC22_004695 [Naganishia vaughanmartiniae]
MAEQESQQMLQMMKDFLRLVYTPATAAAEPAADTAVIINEFICSRVPEAAIPAFYLFSKLLPGIIPRNAFDDLIKGYEMDLSFSVVGDEGNESAAAAAAAGMPNGRQRDSRQSIMEQSPIKTEYDLVIYADRVAGSVADMICHLAWAILDPEGGQGTNGNAERIKTLAMARQMGQALQFVNIARDIRTDALLRRLYIPLTMFTDREQDLEALFNKPETLVGKDYARYTLPLLGIANTLRTMSAGDIENLPRTARAGTRAMVASYFEIGKEIERRGGALDSERLKVSRWRRLGAVLRCFWGWDQDGVSRGSINTSS